MTAMQEKPYDVVIIGSGVGGGAVALQLAGSGARVLILERGPVLPRECFAKSVAPRPKLPRRFSASIGAAIWD